MLLPEIVDHIFNFLQSDINTLKACTEAHPILAQLAERHLYAHITIQNLCYHTLPGRMCTVSWLSKSFSDSPHLASYVSILYIEITGIPDYKTFLEKLAVILPLFSKVKTIALIGRECRWEHFPYAFHAAFIDMLYSPHVRELKIKGVRGF